MKKNIISILLPLAVIIQTYSPLFAAPPVEPDHIRNLSEYSSKIYNSFLNETIIPRIAWSLCGEYPTDSGRKLVRKTAEETAAKLKPIAQAQETARRRIEEY